MPGAARAESHGRSGWRVRDGKLEVGRRKAGCDACRTQVLGHALLPRCAGGYRSVRKIRSMACSSAFERVSRLRLLVRVYRSMTVERASNRPTL